ncbi:MAG: TonB-dependent receptor [Gammaproteobacteria bacterium]|nr:TonB-dependent receptor [Gammaproteobacteria bacterium]
MRTTQTLTPLPFTKATQVVLLTFAAAMLPGSLYAQQTSGGSADEEAIEEIVVEGTRATIQSTINIKRASTTIVDGLSAVDIGDLPALSIGEALETITGVASHRENGGATEISIRGLGPFLSATTFNGRMATNGTGDRSVNFSQFPSELMNKLAIYKTQDASLIEGGVAGLIELETLRPLDYGKRRFQADVKGNYNPDQQNIADTMGGDIGYRATASYVDQFEFDSGSLLGVSFGLQFSDISQPEQEMRSSSPSGTSLFACLADNDTNQGYTNVPAAGEADDCEDTLDTNRNAGFNTAIDPNTGVAFDDDRPYAWAGSSRGFRQNDTHDTRDAVFAALQWQPNDKLEINLDVQWSEREQAEDRYDLNFANMKRNTPGVTLDALQFQSNGVVTSWAGETDIDSNGELYSRVEEYLGWGIDVSYYITDKLSVAVDLSSNETTRVEQQASFRQQSPSRQDATFSRNNEGFVTWTVEDFDITDPANFDDNLRVRLDTDADRENTIDALRVDFNYALDSGFINSVDFGARVSELSYYAARGGSATGSNGARIQLTVSDADPAVMACARAFPESSYMSSSDAGPLVTNVAGNGSVIDTYNSWAIFDNACRRDAILAGNDASLAYPVLGNHPETVDVTEDTQALYVKANYEGEWGDKLVRGNFGVRVVNTDVTSVGYRSGFIVATDPVTSELSLEATGDLDAIAAKHDYTEVLPSVNFVMDLTDDLVLRAGIFRGLSRADPGDMGFQRAFQAAGDDEDPPLTIEELITGVTGSGNPYSDPLTSWNYDIALEWYPNEDSILAATVYLKDFTGGFTNTVIQEQYVVDGETLTFPIVLQQTNDSTSTLAGIELTASHNFSYLPAFLSGFGAKISYNYADSDFEFEDSLYGDRGFIDDSGNFVQTHEGIIPPGNVPGFSRETFSGQLYYQVGEFDGSLIYKYRSGYFQPYTSNGTRLRYIGEVGVVEARASYYVTDNIRLSVEAINLLDEPKSQYFFVKDNLGEMNYYGPRVFVGLRGKFF